MAIKIKYKGNVIRTAENGQTAEVDCAGHKFTENLFIEVFGGGSSNCDGCIIDVDTEAKMTALLESAEAGSVVKYTGESTDTYESGGLYIVEAVSE